MQSRPRSDYLTAYSAMRIRQYIDDGDPTHTGSALAEGARVSPAHISNIKNGRGVGSSVTERLARFFGMTHSEYIKAAEEWWAKEGRDTVGEAMVPTPQDDAIVLARKAGVPVDAIERTVEAYSGPAFQTKSVAWWLETLLREWRESGADTPNPPSTSPHPLQLVRPTAARRRL